MEIFLETDFEKIASCANEEVNDADFKLLKSIYQKLEYLCLKLRDKGFDFSLRKDPRRQAGQGLFLFQEYQWARVYPKEYAQICRDKFCYIIDLSDGLNFHMMGVKKLQDENPSLSASKHCWTQVDYEDKSYEQIVDDFLDFDRKYRKLFIKTGASLGITELQNELNKMKELTVKELLKNKHQVILQGPPGTGKTRKAKELAIELCKPKEITKDDIIKILKVGIKIPSSTNYTNYEISGVNDNSISLKLENNSVYNPSISNIIGAYKNKLWLGGQVGGNHPYEAALAMYIFEHYPINDYFKIVQFHPSYSYEDFVRGISVKTVNGYPSYETENRTLMKFANDALENYLNSKKTSAELSKEKWIASELNIFTESISGNLANGKLYELTENVNIIDIQDDAFIYTGNTWQAVNGHRMKFTDIIKAYLQNAGTRQEYQNVLGISGRAFQHATYDFKLLVKFKDFLTTRPKFIETTIKSELKNYVLIIDEINRANLASVLGELIYALEYRNESVESLYELDGGDKKLILPPNFKIIGTMNTADRSVGHIDYAIRRRFAFVDVLPEIEPVHKLVIDKFKSVASLFVNNFDADPRDWVRSEHMAADFQPHEVMIGHSYFICKKEGSNDDEEDIKAKEILDLKMEFEVVPILNEYIKDGILNDTPEVKAIINGLIS